MEYKVTITNKTTGLVWKEHGDAVNTGHGYKRE